MVDMSTELKGLASLPAEIQNQVISNIETSATLLRLALSSRSYYNFTAPYLFRCIKLHYQEGEGFRYLSTFTTRILKNPHIASFVHELALQGGPWSTRINPGP